MRHSVKKFEGVFYRERKALFNGRPDRTFEICWRERGRKRWLTVGRLSLGVTAQTAHQRRLEILAALSRTAAPEAVPIPATVPAPAPTRTERPPTVGEALENYTAYKRRVNPESRLARPSAAVKKFFKDMELDDVTPVVLERYQQERLAMGRRPSTVNNELAALAGAFSLAIKSGLRKTASPVSAAAGYRRLPPRNAGERWLSPDEARRLLDALAEASPLWHDVAALSLATGMRLGEIYKLRVGDLRLDAGTAVFTAKSGERETVRLAGKAAGILAARSEGKPPSGLVFTGPDGGRVKKATPFTRVVGKLGFNDGITDKRHRVWFHTLRHTFASWLVQ
ncbi:MAG: site-specific integrase, partial [Deltaproteobacteria bacterium]|nr:site-specific integrase [Deltaproteobacteria bacterium]